MVVGHQKNAVFKREGWVIEWFKVPVLKTGVLSSTVGSNPTPSVILEYNSPGKVAERFKALVC